MWAERKNFNRTFSRLDTRIRFKINQKMLFDEWKAGKIEICPS